MSTNAAFRSPSGALSYLHWDGYPEAVLPALAMLVGRDGAEAALAQIMSTDWDVLREDEQEPLREDVIHDPDGPMRTLPDGATDEQLLGRSVRWVYDLDMDGVTVTHPCDDRACPRHQLEPVRRSWFDLTTAHL